jgi:hypothetical protein
MKNIKERLDDLQDLLEGGYVTEDEYRVARVNILREEGMDIAIHSRAPEGRRAQAEEANRDGCGIYSLALLILIFVVAAGTIFVASRWSEPFGGRYLRTAREWILTQWSNLSSGFSGETQRPLPDPIPSNAPVSEDAVVPLSVTSAEIPALSELVPETKTSPDKVLAVPLSDDAVSGGSTLQALDPQNFALPDIETPESEGPNVKIIEIPFAAFTPAPPSSAPSEGPARTLRRGVVSVRSARIRSTPDTSRNDNIVGWGSSGDRFSVLEEETNPDGALWYNIRYEDGGKQGWISASLVTLEE